MSIVRNAVFLAEDALKAFFANVAPDFVLYENLTVKELVDSANSFRDADAYYREMSDQSLPRWNVDPDNKEVTVTFSVKSLRKGQDADSGDTHLPEVRFMGVAIQDVDPKALRKNSRSRVKNMIPLHVPKDPNMDVDAWVENAYDKYDSPEAMDKAMAALFKTYYVEPLTSKTQIAVRCTCEDFHWTFLRANRAKGAYFGKPLKGFDAKGTGKPRNPDQVPGYCVHLRYALEVLASEPEFWQAKVKLAGAKKHKVDSDDIGVWADAAGY